MGATLCKSGTDEATRLQRQYEVVGIDKNEHRRPTFEEHTGKVHLLIVCLDYKYDPPNELNAIKDGYTWCGLAARAGVEDVTMLSDDIDPDDPEFDDKFPTAENVSRYLVKVARNCEPGDTFVFFYAGHGENIPDQYPYDEDDGTDEAYVTATLERELDETKYLVDDNFCRLLEQNVPEDCKILVLSDCCHSASICDVDSFAWDHHKIISLSACKDNQTDADTSEGGCLTISIRNALNELMQARGNSEFSVASVLFRLIPHAKAINDEQDVQMQFHGIEPEDFSWPIVPRRPA